jgi:SAM-dependent methyltransferase
MGGKVTHRLPIFTDYDDQAGSATGHYFHQDLLVASFIHNKNPLRHIDIGSRIDGFIAHVASFRSIEVMDVRDLKGTGHENISFIKADLMNKDSAQNNITDSISCLHAIEHFGLGRYGDPVDPDGHIKGFNNILRMLKPGGNLYMSFPIANHNEVHFNAHRVFHPQDIFTWVDDKNSIRLERFDYVDDAGKLHQKINIETDQIDVIFGCGIYTLKKLH